MNHRVFGNRLSRPFNARKALIRGLILELLTNKKIATSKARAKAILGEVDKIAILIKKEYISSRRRLEALVPGLTDGLIKSLKIGLSSRNSGFVKTCLLGTRLSDNQERVEMTLLYQMPEEKIEEVKLKNSKKKKNDNGS